MKKIWKVLFYISFLPYIFILLWGCFNAINGTTFIFSEIYGFDAFLLTLVAGFIVLVCNVPIIPICFIYQIAYLLKGKIKIDIKKYATIFIVIGVLLVSIILISTYSYEIGSFFEKQDAKAMIKVSDEKVSYDENDIHYGGIFGFEEFENSHILIDYDKNELGFLLHPSYDEFFKVKLNKSNIDSNEYKDIVNNYYLQTEIKLSKGTLLTFSEEDVYFRTIAIIFIKGDEIYLNNKVVEPDTDFSRYTGLNDSEYFVGKNIKYNDYKNS